MMNPSIFSATLTCFVLCSCASPPGEQANASAGVPGNAVDAGMIPAKQVSFERRQSEMERANLMQRIKELSNEVSSLKEAKSSVATSAPTITAAPNPDAAVAQANANSAAPGEIVPSAKVRVHKTIPARPLRPNRETILIQENGMVFRVMHDFARTEFHPSKSLQQQLLQAARAGKRIDIRGRTDARAPNEVDQAIALQRALNARLFLANNGIHPRKMHLNVQSAGDNIADNATSEGRARNRRVDIETAGISPEALEALATVIRKDLQ